ncbi:vWA domain-containing protein [Falsibacillus albus]|uniref:VWA domain-containing protein n=1 Tax=Falsibacillus albus TaxID=2478915 RepID=A0A3L7K0F4_9BACI|nr:VWA domain-containing protein [Falsibacillus albus]RLQ95421.1 VWA domain-containing protein [Falsibacillus albus]
MQRFIQFNDEKIDSMLFMELTDLAKTLAKDEEYEVEFGVQSYLDLIGKKVYVSHFWNHRTQDEIWAGMKSDVFLRTVGNLKYTDFNEVIAFISKLKKTGLSSLGKQLFVVFEDLRIEEMIKRERPGTTKAFQVRRSIYRKHFETQQNVNLVKSVFTDALFNTIYLLIHSTSPLEEVPTITEKIELALPFIRQQLMKVYESKSTKENINICLELIDVLDEIVEKDMLNEYFHLPEKVYFKEETSETFDDLKRKDPLKNRDVQEKEKEENEEVFEEEMKTWHRETKDMSKSFLQFDLDQGTQTDLLGEGVREGDAGDQALGIVQGSSKQTSRNDYSQMEAVEKSDAKEGKEGLEFGKENRYAYPIFLKPDPPAPEEIKTYNQLVQSISTYQKKLKKMIEKTLEHKRIQPRTDLHFGRLSKRLLRYFTDDAPRLFYKKSEPSREIDAVFSLLVDCSASMFDKMDETKIGIALFHEALKGVAVPHEIVGFWEDTNDATETSQPNYFKTVIDYTSSTLKRSGAEIMQLEPEEDNRDGYAIRITMEKLLQRHEKQKFLLVFSDGEPAAMGYEQNGIVDTHEAVLEARKQGIEVINVFLSNVEIEESQKKVIQNMYGRFSLFVSNIEDLPDILFPLLRKLLYKSL